MEGSILQNALIFIGAALVFVPISKKMGIGSVLGYIIAGAVIGPYMLGFIGGEGEDIMHAAEFGVVMMLFIIGLELNPQSFWRMRKTIVGMGGLQMGLTALVFWPLLHFGMQMSMPSSIAVALSFAMSSTAIVLQTLKEKGLDKTQAGSSSFAVLLFQDIAVIPILAILPLLAITQPVETVTSHSPAAGFVTEYPTLTILIAVLTVYVLGRFLVRPWLHFIARVHMRELFTASALFIVIGVSWLMQLVDISPALGAFMAGVLLANSEFRHELESDIEPFKGLLLGLFFTAVGSTINFALIVEKPWLIASLVALTMFIKAVVLFIIGKAFKLITIQNWLFAFLLSQAGEFGFVLLASAGQLELLDAESQQLFMAVIPLSMIVSPILLFGYDKFIAPKMMVLNGESSVVPEVEEKNEIIIAGFGHFGSTLGRFLRANKVNATFLDNDSDRVSLLTKMGFKVYYGDATRLELLEAAGAAQAKILISAIDSPRKNLELMEMVKKHFPHLKVFARAKNRFDAYELLDLGIERVYRENLHSSVFLGADVLSELGRRKYTVSRKAMEFIKYDDGALRKLGKQRHDQKSYLAQVREEIALQEKLMDEDFRFSNHKQDNAWDKTVMK